MKNVHPPPKLKLVDITLVILLFLPIYSINFIIVKSTPPLISVKITNEMLTCISRELQKYQISKGLNQLRGERNQGFLQLRLKKRDDLTRRIIIADRLAVKKTPLLSSSYSRWYAFLFFALYFPILHDLRERETTQVHLFWFWW